ncbi:MAG: LytR C-terminal domain-containing protein [Thermotogae bacterium]|nr:LytR C-terminal domain-containing protein [Thermotogota bacterium]
MLRLMWVSLMFVFLAITVAPFVFRGKSSGESITDQRLDVIVLNGTRRNRLAYSVTRYLRSKGIDVLYYGNADTLYAQTLIIDRRDSVNLTNAKKVARYVKGKIIYMPDTDNIASVYIILGNDYR